MARARSSPEEAARGDIPERFVKVVSVVRRDTLAVVCQLTNDHPPHEIDTAYCQREEEGWVAKGSGNSSTAFLPAGNGVGTVVVWDEAPAEAVAARFEYDGSTRIVPVESGCAVAVFDDVPDEDGLLGAPRLAAWITPDGSEVGLPFYPPSERLREIVRSGEFPETTGGISIHFDPAEPGSACHGLQRGDV